MLTSGGMSAQTDYKYLEDRPSVVTSMYNWLEQSNQYMPSMDACKLGQDTPSRYLALASQSENCYDCWCMHAWSHAYEPT